MQERYILYRLLPAQGPTAYIAIAPSVKDQGWRSGPVGKVQGDVSGRFRANLFGYI